jgi:hypothetical protein
MKRSSKQIDSPRKQQKVREVPFSAALIPAFIYSEIAVFLKAEELLLSAALVCGSWYIGISSHAVWDEVKKRDFGHLYESLSTRPYREGIRATYMCYPDPTSNRICWMHPIKRSLSWSILTDDTLIKRKGSWLLLKSAELFLCGGCKANNLMHNMQLLTLYNYTCTLSLTNMTRTDLRPMPEAKMMVPIVEAERAVFAFGGISNAGWALSAHKCDLASGQWTAITPCSRHHLSFSPVLHHQLIYLICKDGIDTYSLPTDQYSLVLSYSFSAHNLAWLQGDNLYIADPVLVSVNIRTWQVRAISTTPLRAGMWWSTPPFAAQNKVYIGQRSKILCLDMRNFAWETAVDSV